MVDWHAHKQVKTVDDSELKLKYFKLLLAGVRDRQSTKATIWSALVSHSYATAIRIVILLSTEVVCTGIQLASVRS
jgi:hypothetical protein